MEIATVPSVKRTHYCEREEGVLRYKLIIGNAYLNNKMFSIYIIKKREGKNDLTCGPREKHLFQPGVV
jgi:hypothetical protein